MKFTFWVKVHFMSLEYVPQFVKVTLIVTILESLYMKIAPKFQNSSWNLFVFFLFFFFFT